MRVKAFSLFPTKNIKKIAMSVKIEPTENDNYKVNGKEIWKDSSGNWIAKNPDAFRPSELKAFSNYKDEKINQLKTYK